MTAKILSLSLLSCLPLSAEIVINELHLDEADKTLSGEFIDPLTAPNHDDSSSWIAQETTGGSPGLIDPATSYATWKLVNNISDDLTDPDQDSIPNLLEYFFGTDPNQIQASAPIQSSIESQHLTFTFTRSANLAGITYRVELSPDLSSWDDTSAIRTNLTNNNDGTITETWQAPFSTSDQEKHFIRLPLESTN